MGRKSIVKEYDYLYKLLLIGDSGVGKSNILLRFVDNKFEPTFISTIGLDFRIKTIELNGKKVKLQLWDTAGQEKFKAITTSYYRGAHGIILVYDITDINSFHHVPNWNLNIEGNAPENTPKLLVGNKCDLENKRVISREQGGQTAKDIGALGFYETSALSGKNIDEMVVEMVKHVHEHKMKLYEKNTLVIEAAPNKESFCHC